MGNMVHPRLIILLSFKCTNSDPISLETSHITLSSAGAYWQGMVFYFTYISYLRLMARCLYFNVMDKDKKNTTRQELITRGLELDIADTYSMRSRSDRKMNEWFFLPLPNENGLS